MVVAALDAAGTPAAQWWFGASAAAVTASDPAGRLPRPSPGMGGLLPPFGDASLGQDQAQPACWLVVSLPFLQLSRLSATRSSLVGTGWLRMGAKAFGPNPASATRPGGPVPHLWALAPYPAVSLRPVTRDNPGEMGGRGSSLARRRSVLGPPYRSPHRPWPPHPRPGRLQAPLPRPRAKGLIVRNASVLRDHLDERR